MQKNGAGILFHFSFLNRNLQDVGKIDFGNTRNRIKKKGNGLH